MPEREPPTETELDGASEIVISGEALIFGFTLGHAAGMELSRATIALISDLYFMQGLHRQLVKAIEKTLGEGYVVDSLVPESKNEQFPGQLYLRLLISGTETLTTDQIVQWRPGRTFVDKCNAARERCRKEVVSAFASRTEEPFTVRGAWELGSGVQVRATYSSASASTTELYGRLAELARRERGIKLRRTYGIMALVLAPIVGLALWELAKSAAAVTLGLAYLIGPGALLFLVGSEQVSTLSAERRELTDALELRDTEDERERRALKLVQANAFALRRYYDQALSQRSSVFVLGILCILAGFGTVGASFALVRATAPGDESAKIVIGVLGGIGGLLANYVAAIFLRMFSATVRAATEFHTRLVGTQHVNLGYLVAAKIDNDATRNETLSRMAVALCAEPHYRLDSSTGKAAIGSPDNQSGTRQ